MQPVEGAPAEAKLTRATVSPALVLEIRTDPFRLTDPTTRVPRPRTQNLGASEAGAGEIHGDSQRLSAAPGSFLSHLAPLQLLLSKTPFASLSTPMPLASSPMGARLMVSSSVVAPKVPEAPREGDPLRLDAVLLSQPAPLAVIDGCIRAKGQSWSTPAGVARVVEVGLESVLLEVGGRSLKLDFDQARAVSTSKPSAKLASSRSKGPRS